MRDAVTFGAQLIGGHVYTTARDNRDRAHLGFVPHSEEPGVGAGARYLAGVARIGMGPHGPEDVNVPRMREQLRETAARVPVGSAFTIHTEGAERDPSSVSGYRLTSHEITWYRGQDGRFYVQPGDVPPGTRVLDLNQLLDRQVPDHVIRTAMQVPSTTSENAPTQAEHDAARAALTVAVPSADDEAVRVGPNDPATRMDAGAQQPDATAPPPASPGADPQAPQPSTGAPATRPDVNYSTTDGQAVRVDASGRVAPADGPHTGAGGSVPAPSDSAHARPADANYSTTSGQVVHVEASGHVTQPSAAHSAAQPEALASYSSPHGAPPADPASSPVQQPPPDADDHLHGAPPARPDVCGPHRDPTHETSTPPPAVHHPSTSRDDD